jgi:protein involved in polysaccharide export with SLBB domain
MTLSQAQDFLSKEVTGYVRGADVLLTLNELRTFTVSVLGESFAPGVYQVPASFSIFNLSLATGGPSGRGSMRSVQLRRNNSPARTFDLYKFLIDGQASQDIQLQPGDVIFYPVSKGQASVAGEVNRPGVFELLGGETLKSLMNFAGGVRPSAVAQNVAIDSIVPGSERRLLNVDLQNKKISDDPRIFDGDKIQVFSIRAIIRNSVVISGAVEQPRTYTFREGMRISDLVRLSLGLLSDADTSIAELQRANEDGSKTLVRVNLASALRGDRTADLVLRPDDSLKIYTLDDIAWRGDRKVALTGAVRNPGEFVRADAMRVGDLLRQGRGLEPDAYTQEGHLQRFNADGTPGPLVKVNLIRASMGDPDHDMLLQDRDRLRVYRLSEWQAVPDQAVSIAGAVQRPGNYPLASGMKVKDLIELSGNLVLNAHQSDAFLQRVNTDGTLGPLLLINPKKALGGDPAHNLALSPRDTLRLYTMNEWKAIPEMTVEVSGAVQRPSAYGLAEGMTVRDLISQAGGPALNAFLDQAFLQRTNPDGTVGALVIIDLNKALAGDPKENVMLQSKDKLSVYAQDQAKFMISRTVQILGGVQRPGTFARGEGMTLSQLIAMAGGTIPTSSAEAIIASANVPEGTPVVLVPLDQADKQLLKDKDVVTIPVDSSILTEPIQVLIQGAVARPGVYFFTRRDQKVTDLIALAGGLRPEAWLKGAQVARRPEFLRTDAQLAQQPRLVEVLKLIQTDEYKRAVARAEVDRLLVISSATQGGSSPFNVVGLIGAPTTLPAQQAVEADAAIANQVKGGDLVTPARTKNIVETLVGGNLSARLDEAVRNPRSAQNFSLRSGDVITIPEVPNTVVVDGPGVVLPQAFIAEPGGTLLDYIRKSGGLTVDADPSNTLIIRPGGSLFRPRANTKVEPGDVVFVPTKVMAANLRSSREDFDRVVKLVTNGALLYGILRSLTR